MSLNRVTISGNLTREPELRQTPSGYEILNVGVAVNDRRKNQQSGEWEDYANFVDVVVFGKRASSLSKILTKGMKVAIDGKLRYSSWEDKEGHKRSKLEVIAEDVDIMQRKGDGSGGSYGGGSGNYSGGGGNGSQNGSQPPTGPSQGYDDMYDDDIPF